MTGDVGVLRRDMSSFGGLLITLSCLSPSIGVFIVGSDIFKQVGAGVFPCFLAAAALGVAVAMIYAELGSAFPHAGGEYTIIGRVLGPSGAFAVLALNLTGFCIAQALSGLGVADYLAAVFPGVQPAPTAIVTVLLVTLVGVLSVKVNAWVTGLFLAVEISALVATAVLGLTHWHAGAVAAIGGPKVLTPTGGVHAVSLAALGAAAAGGIYAFNGYGAVIFLGEEIRDARKRLGGVVFWALGIAALTELIPILAVIGGAAHVTALTGARSPISAFIREAGGEPTSKILSLCVAAAVFNAMIAVALVGGRQLYATGRDRCWPDGANRIIGLIHPRYGSPWAATLVMGAASLGCCFVPLKILVMTVSNGLVVIYGMLCLAVLAGRRSGVTAHSHTKMPLFPLAPVLVLMALAGVVIADLFDAENGRMGLLVTVATALLGAAYYLLVLRRKPAWAHAAVEEEVLQVS